MKSRAAATARKLERVPALAPGPALPTPEQLIGAIVEAIAPPLFDSIREEAATSRSGVYATLPRRGEEHRAHPRVPVAVDIGMETESHFFSGLSGDISEGGVFVQTYRDLPVGSDVEVRFGLPDGELTVHGCVRWHRAASDSSPPGVGIAFEGLPEDERQLIHAFCERRAPLYYEVERG